MDAAHRLLSDLCFLLVPGAPFDRGPSYLLVALRPRPTRSHFDPERIEFWQLEAGRAEAVELEWPMHGLDRRFGWGPIRIVDRVAAANQFVSFGGRLTVSRDGQVHAALFRSDAPILAAAGHSGPADPLAANISAYFARLRAAAGADPVFGAACDAADPLTLYAAFLAHARTLYIRPTAAEAVSPRLLSILRSEACRLQREVPSNVLVGDELAARLDAW
jgi:hypothetical protein